MMTGRMRSTILAASLVLVGLVLPLGGQQAPADLLRLADRLAGQLDIAIQHAVLGRLAAGTDDLKIQAHQVLNVLVGREGPGYEPRFGDPGDGVGLVNYARQLGLAVADLGQSLRLIAENLLFFINAATEEVRAAIRTGREGDARQALYRGMGFLLAARGCPDDLPSEGGVRTLQRLIGRSP